MRASNAVGALSVLAVLFAALVVDTPAVGAAGVQAPCGNTAASPTLVVDRPTIGADETAVVTVTGRSYLLAPHVCGTDVFGGVYLFFGWVQPGGQWGPSHKSSTSTQGLFGATYSYPGDGGGAETRDDGTGTIRLISFTAGGESGTSTPFHMDGRGNWSSTLTVRGATYSYRDLRTGATSSVDCRVVQCGVFTIGAHGKASRTNEVFTPITFVDATGASGPATTADLGAAAPSAGAPGAAAPAPAGGTTAGAGDAATAPGAGIDPTTTTTAPVPGGDSSAAAAEEVLDAQEAAAVQDFGAEGTDGPPPLLVAAAAIVAVGLAAAVVLARRRAAGAR